MHILVTKGESAEICSMEGGTTGRSTSVDIGHARRQNKCEHISQYVKSCGGKCVCLAEAHSTMARRNVARGESARTNEEN